MTKNFILSFLTYNKVFFIWAKNDAYDLIVIDRNSLLSWNRRINNKTKLLLVVTQQYYEKIIFHIIQMVNYNIILGILQSTKYNPIINQEKKTIWLKTYNYVVIAQHTYQQRLIVNKKQNQKTITKRKLSALTKDNLY